MNENIIMELLNREKVASLKITLTNNEKVEVYKNNIEKIENNILFTKDYSVFINLDYVVKLEVMYETNFENLEILY